MRIGFANDHGGFALREVLIEMLRREGHEVIDFGAVQFVPQDDYPDYVEPLARAVAQGQADRGVAVCGSGVGASVAANKVAGVRAALITDIYSAHQGVEDDDMNLICLGGGSWGLSWQKSWSRLFCWPTSKRRNALSAGLKKWQTWSAGFRRR